MLPNLWTWSSIYYKPLWELRKQRLREVRCHSQYHTANTEFKSSCCNSYALSSGHGGQLSWEACKRVHWQEKDTKLRDIHLLCIFLSYTKSRFSNHIQNFLESYNYSVYYPLDLLLGHSTCFVFYVCICVCFPVGIDEFQRNAQSPRAPLFLLCCIAQFIWLAESKSRGSFQHFY